MRTFASTEAPNCIRTFKASTLLLPAAQCKADRSTALRELTSTGGYPSWPEIKRLISSIESAIEMTRSVSGKIERARFTCAVFRSGVQPLFLGSKDII